MNNEQRDSMAQHQNIVASEESKRTNEWFALLQKTLKN